jgi:hypothetical protein
MKTTEKKGLYLAKKGLEGSSSKRKRAKELGDELTLREPLTVANYITS